MSAENRNSVKLSKASTYLSGEENELVFRLLGRRCQSQCTTVAQIYQTEAPHTRWMKRYTGALCFVKDNSNRSYFARLFCLVKHELVWEQEMYDTIEINKVKPFLLTFEGQDGMVALNFAFDDEAETFLSTAINTVQSRNRRREERRNRIRKEPPARPPPITTTVLSEEPVILRNPSSITKITPNQFQPPYTQQPSSLGNAKTKKREVKKITKEDIGLPSNFKHVTHVGWNAKSGFDLSGEDEALKPFLQKAGVSENQLKDRRTRDFIYDFIQSNNVEEIVRKETKKPAAPSVPTRNPQNNGEKPIHRLAPPPPPPPVQRDYQQNSRDISSHKNQAPTLPSPQIVVRNTPPKSNSNTAPQAPPPPPPPTQINMPPPPPPMKESTVSVIPDARSALMDSIRKGAQLKKIDASSTNSNTGGDSRNDLLSEIRGGIELRPVSDRSNNQANRSSDGNGTDALADALRRALEQRKTAINGTSSSESENENSDDGEWSD